MRHRQRALAAFFALGLASFAQPLAGTRPLEAGGDLALEMVEGIHRWLDRETVAAAARRAGRTDTPDRAWFRRIIGAVNERVPDVRLILERDSLVAKAPGYEVHAARWPVLEGVDAEGLLLEPAGPPVARVIVLPDADWAPEMLAGLAPGAPTARRLAESGVQVFIPVLIDRQDTWSGSARLGRFTNQPHREFIHRMAYEMGRTLIGYEVQKVLAAVDWFAGHQPRVPVGVAGHGEGGLIAFFAAALDTRIDAALVSGYFGPRERLHEEPIYRNVWSLLRDFGDAEIAGLIAPRPLVIEASGYPEVAGPPAESKVRRGAAPGRLWAPSQEEVRGEFARAKRRHPGAVLGGAEEFWRALGQKTPLRDIGGKMIVRGLPDASARHKRQFEQLVEFTQALVRRAEETRRRFWSKAQLSSLEGWQQTSGWYRRYLWEEVIGKMPDPSEPIEPRTRRAYDEPRWTGYEVVLPVWPDVYAYGVLLVPKDLKPGERRPVVVCQHGLEGRPQDVIEAKGEKYYERFAARLAERGFVVFAPQNPYIGVTRFRQIQRKANPLKLSLFSFITGQHQRILEWLASLPFVDPERIGFYGLSYGGKTAVRVPPLVERYALSICSADFNEWIWKNTRVDASFSYMFTQEYDMLEFDLGNTFNYAELAWLMAPRPFMVERGHNDGVSVDEWVAYEYAKVRRQYAVFGIPERTAIEFFNGPHKIHGVGTFEFLHRHLRWAER